MRTKDVISVYTTPEELRRIADDLEQRWAESSGELPRKIMWLAQGGELHFVIDRVEMESLVREGKSPAMGAKRP